MRAERFSVINKFIFMETIKISVPAWNIEQLTGYKPISTFWQDFSIADAFGAKAVLDTFKMAFKEYCHDCKMMTELAMVLNHKTFAWFDVDSVFSKLYNDLYCSLDAFLCEHLEDDELQYYFETTD